MEMSEMLTLWANGMPVTEVAIMYDMTYSKVYGQIQRELRAIERELYTEYTL